MTVIAILDEYEEIEEGEDDGGPTRQFLSEVWSQLGKLTVLKKDGERLQLFDIPSDKTFFTVLANHQIEKLSEDQNEQARLYYR